MNRLGMNYVKAKVVCNTDDIYTPVLDGKQVSLCDEEDIRTALGLNDVKILWCAVIWKCTKAMQPKKLKSSLILTF